MKREASARRNTDDNGERVGVMYVGCNMVVDSGGGGLLLGRSLRPSLRPPRHLSLPPSLLLSGSLALFPRSRGKTLKSQQWSQREMGKRGWGDGAQRFSGENGNI